MAIDLEIRKQLERVAARQRRLQLWGNLALAWAASGLAGLGLWLFERQVGWSSSLGLPLVALLGLGGAAIAWVRYYRRTPRWLQVAAIIETRHPELEGRLVTSLQQEPGAGGQLNYLQQRLVGETLQYGRKADWTDIVQPSRLWWVQSGHWLALGLFLTVLIGLHGIGGHRVWGRIIAQGVTVTPGDVTLERGTSLVVLARFKGALPAQVDLVFGQSPAMQRVSLVKSLGDPMFGGSVSEVSSNFVYRVEYGGQRTRDFAVKVYEHPRLERADAELTYPTYTGLSPKRIENTRRLSAVEGTHVDLAFRFNKPVASARLVARDKEHTAVPLAIEPGQPKASLNRFDLQSSKTYDLQLVDAEGRTNKAPAEFVFDVLKNRTPEMRLTSPQGDVRPSPLEEITFSGTVWDDFGIRAFGLAYSANGQTPNFIELGRDVPGNQKRSFKHLLRLEDLKAKPDELLSWFVWADDLGPDGQVRRTMGDLYFGEVRPFDEVFREGQGMQGESSPEMSGQDRTGKLTDLEKEIVNATWRLERDHAGHAGPPEATPGGQGSTAPSRESTGGQGQSSVPRRLSLPAWVLAGPAFSGVPAGFMAAPEESPEGPDTAPPNSRNSAKAAAPGTGAAPKYEDDAGVVLDSQAQALEQAKESLRRQRDPQTAALWQKAVTEMETALAHLQQATNSPARLKEALAAEQSAYQALVRLQAHEYQVSRSRGQSGSSRNQQMERQLEQLDLSESDNRYENQRQAERSQNPERREQLQIMSRLQELARRQQDLNQRLKELQTALQEARTEQERAEIQRQLKRLQEQEQQMLADVDELRQRMDRPENQSRMADERQQLDQTRQEVQKASEAAAQGAASQALAAGTRAQSQLQQLRDEIRRKNSSQFAEDLRQMRRDARELSRRQDEILKNIQSADASDRKTLSNSQDQEQTRAQLARQQELMTNLLARATQISQQAEEAEPLLSRQLYDTVRKVTQDSGKDLKDTQQELLTHGPMTRSLFDLLRDNSDPGAAKLEQITSEMVRLGNYPQAGRIGQRARSGIENLRKGVERAADSVLGDDTDDLRLAQRQLDDLTGQLQREIADNQGSGSQTNGATSGNSARQSGNRSGEKRSSPAQSARQGENGQAGSAGQGQDQSQQQAQAQGQGQAQGQERAQQAQGQGQGQEQAQAQRQGQGQGKGQGQGQQPGSPSDQQQQASAAQAAQAGQAQGQEGQAESAEGQTGQGTAQGKGTGANTELAQNGQGQRGAARANRRSGLPGPAAGGGGDPGDATEAGGGINWNRVLTENAQREAAPITGEDFANWSDRLREVEELLDAPDLRDDVAKARERARLVRQDFRRDRKKPDWAVVQLQVMKPLTEVRDRIADELARRESREALVPLDRDPVPNRYSDLVRRYYEELGKDK